MAIFAMLPPEPTIQAIVAAGGRVDANADVHSVGGLFLASGDIPRRPASRSVWQDTTVGAVTS